MLFWIVFSHFGCSRRSSRCCTCCSAALGVGLRVAAQPEGRAHVDPARTRDAAVAAAASLIYSRDAFWHRFVDGTGDRAHIGAAARADDAKLAQAALRRRARSSTTSASIATPRTSTRRPTRSSRMPALLFNIGQAYRAAGDNGEAHDRVQVVSAPRARRAEPRRGRGTHRQAAEAGRRAARDAAGPTDGDAGADHRRRRRSPDAGHERQLTARRRLAEQDAGLQEVVAVDGRRRRASSSAAWWRSPSPTRRPRTLRRRPTPSA